jgi:uracil DNA glycosylase
LKVEGGNYPPAAPKQMIAQTLSALKFVFIIAIVLGQNPFHYLNMATPEAFTWALENKVYACMMTFFLSNMIEGQLISTGE